MLLTPQRAQVTTAVPPCNGAATFSPPNAQRGVAREPTPGQELAIGRARYLHERVVISSPNRSSVRGIRDRFPQPAETSTAALCQVLGSAVPLGRFGKSSARFALHVHLCRNLVTRNK